MNFDLMLRYFGVGATGGLANSLAVWLCGSLGVTALLGVDIAPQLSAGWLYPRIVWGGIWGVLLLLPFALDRLWLRAFVLSLAPTAVQLFIVFPFKADKGWAGLELGLLAPVFVVLFNFIWAVVAVSLGANHRNNG